MARLEVVPFPNPLTGQHSLGGSLLRATVWPSASFCDERYAITKALISAHAEAEDRKLRKDPTFGGSLL
jgi:hypothetical protein